MKKQQEEESGEKAPLWIISFADMISLLMAFFVMLQTMASEHSNELLSGGAANEKVAAVSYEFRRNIDGFGMPGIFGSSHYSGSMKATQNKFKVEGDDEEVTTPAQDGHTERMQRLFTEISRQAKTSMSQFRGKQLVFEYTPITFGTSEYQLNDAADKYISDCAAALKKRRNLQDLTICIVSAGADMNNKQEQWACSQHRAQAVAQSLISRLPESCSRNIYWWAAGPDLPGLQTGKKPCILIAIDSPPEN